MSSHCVAHDNVYFAPERAFRISGCSGTCKAYWRREYRTQRAPWLRLIVVSLNTFSRSATFVESPDGIQAHTS